MASKASASRKRASIETSRFWRDDDARAFIKALGATIRAIRLEQGLHQEHLGARIGISGSRIGEIERGVVSTRAERIAAIASGLGMTTAALLLRVERGMEGGYQRAMLRATIAETLGKFSLDELGVVATVVASIARVKSCA